MNMRIKMTVIALITIFMFTAGNVCALNNGVLDMSEAEYQQYSDSLHNLLFPISILNTDEDLGNNVPDGLSRNISYTREEYAHAKSAEVNKYMSVGSIPISSGWSQSGAKTYTVPIDVPPGVNDDMTPNMALCYNSQDGMGLAGFGWSMTGLSSIVRCGKSIYYDGTIDGVNMDNTDCFVLDGMRLIEVASGVYQSEQGNIKAIAVLSSGSIVSEVFYPNGHKASFGFKDDLNAICFPITSYSDQWGNKIIYDYLRASGTSYISNITYNNTSSILFKYESYPDNYKQVSYLGGRKSVLDRYLSSVECVLDDNVLCKYELGHGAMDKFGLLVSISYISGDNRFNELKFLYGDTTLDYWKESTTKISKYLTSERNSGLRYVRGKFDYGTGNDGFVCFDNKIPYWLERQTSYIENFTNKYKGDEKIIIYSGLDETSIAPLDTLTTGKGFIDLICADITGSQREDIIRINNYIEGSKDYLFFYIYVQDSISGVRQRTARRFEFVPESPGTSSPSGATLKFRPKHFRVGDFNGDGKMEILVVASNQSNYKSTDKTKCYVLDVDTYDIRYDGYGFEFTSDALGVSQMSILGAENNSDKLIITDINGDGKHEVCHVSNTGTVFYEFNTSGSAWPITMLASFPNLKKSDLINRTLLPCDLNGDGLTDLVISPINDNTGNTWKVLYSKGNGTFEESSFLAMKNNSKEDDCGFFFQDINCDGLPDLIGYDKTSFVVYENGPKNFIPGKSPTVLKRINYPSNLNTPPVLLPVDVISRNSFNRLITIKNGTVTKYSPKNGRLKRTCTMMTNSLGLIEHNYYAFVNNPGENVCTKGNESQYPYVDMYEGLMLLAESRTYLDGNLLDKEAYTYDSPVVHRQGLGFMGFKKIIRTDYKNHVYEQVFDPYRRGVMVSENTPLSESVLEYNLIFNSGKLLTINRTSSTVKDKLKNTSVSTTNTFDGYGNVLTSKTTYSGGNYVTKTYKYDNNAVPADGYHIGYHTDETETIYYNGDSHVSRVAVPSHTRGSPLKRVTYSNGVAVKTEEFQYDGRGLMVKASEKAYTSSNIRTSSFAYDSLGRVISKTDPLGRTNTYTYNRMGLLERETDYRNRSIQYSYDVFGRETMRTTPDTGNTYTSLKWSGADEPGLYSKSVSPQNRHFTYEYFDALNREAARAESRFDGSLSFTSTNYDMYGRVKSESLPYIKGGTPGLWTEYTYDSYDRVTRIDYPSGAYVKHSYNGLSETVEENMVSTVTVSDDMGRTLSVTDQSGTVAYSLRADGQPDKITAPGGAETLFEYDTAGRITLRHDPSEGNTTFTYDSGGNTSSVTDARGKTISYEYDIHDRPTVTRTPEMTVTDTYDAATGDLLRSESTNGYSIDYTYDSAGRLSKELESYGSITFGKSYSYNLGELSKTVLTSSTGLTETEKYVRNFGHLVGITLGDGTKIFERKAVNALGQTTQSLQGPITTDYTFDEYGSLTGRSDRKDNVAVSSMAWDFDPYTGNLLSRTDLKRNITEQFGYDGLNRLTSYGDCTVEYDSNGNILQKSDAGRFSYASEEKPYAITRASFSDTAIPAGKQTVAYTSFSRPSTVKEGTSTATFTYGAGFDRVAMRFKQSGATTTRHYFGGRYERDFTPYLISIIDTNSLRPPYGDIDTTKVNIDTIPEYDIAGDVIERLYLGGDAYTAPAVLVRDGGKKVSPTIYFIVRDYLGSIIALVGKDGSVVQELSYDAWGRMRDPATHALYDIGEEPALRLRRGYCGHEHLPQFGLINMNARLYDPVLGRFLSPDPYVQDPSMPQNFNRYSYCLNNPLCYVDKDGRIPLPIILGIVGAVYNITTNAIDGNLKGDFWTVLGKATVAGAAGFLSGSTAQFGPAAWALSGMALSATNAWLAGGSENDVLNSSITGGISGFVGGFIGQWTSGLGFDFVLNGSRITSPLLDGIVKGAAGGAIGGAASGFATTLMFEGNIDDALDGMWSGATTGAFYGGLTGGIAEYQSAYKQRISPFTGNKMEAHHSHPKFMGGQESQELVLMDINRHRDLHRKLNQKLRDYVDPETGKSMLPTRGYPALKMRGIFDDNLRFNRLKHFYDNNYMRFYDARKQFYKVNGIKWRPIPKK